MRLKALYTTLALVLALPAGFTAPALAQDTRYVSDQQYVPLRSGAGNSYRIVHRGIPSGTRLTVEEVSEDQDWSRIVTARGTEGWIRSQYLMQQQPAALKLQALQTQHESLDGKFRELQAQHKELQENYAVMSEQLRAREDLLADTEGELTEIRRLSSNAITLDENNRKLVQEAEMLRSNIEVLEADNTRLHDSAESEAFINGALAVLLGVIIALVVPRLWPRRRTSSSWA